MTTHRRMTVTYYDADQTSAEFWLCPDLLTLADIGVADNLRGRVVRWFFWLMRRWMLR